MAFDYGVDFEGTYTVGAFSRTGSYLTPLISKPVTGSWYKLFITGSYPGDSTMTIDILDSSKTAIQSGLSALAVGSAQGHYIGDVTQNGLYFCFNMSGTSDAVNSPVLEEWKALYRDGSSLAVIKSDFDDGITNVKNSVKVYGGNQLINGSQFFFSDGVRKEENILAVPLQSPAPKIFTGGSASSYAIANGSLLVEGVDYTIDYNVGKLAWVNIPVSTNLTRAEFQYQRGVFTHSKNSASIASYGEKQTVISDKTIIKQSRAQEIANSILNVYGTPISTGKATVLGHLGIALGQTVVYNIPTVKNFDTFAVKEIKHEIKGGAWYTTYTLSEHEPDFTEDMKKVTNYVNEVRLRQIESQGATLSTQSVSDSFLHGGSLTVKTRDTGSSFIIGTSWFGYSGTSASAYYIGWAGSSWHTAQTASD